MDDDKSDSHSSFKTCRSLKNCLTHSQNGKVTTLKRSESCNKINEIQIEILGKIEILTKRLTKLEEIVNLKGIAGNLNKHYEQTRCGKRNS